MSKTDVPRELGFGGMLNAHTLKDGNHLIPGLPPEYANRKPLKFEGRFLWHPEDGPATAEELANTSPELHERLQAGCYRDRLPRNVFAELRGMIPKANPRVHDMVRAYYTEEAAMLALREAVGIANKQ